MDPVLLERLSRSRLVGEPFVSPAAVVAGLCAVQSQDLLGAAWAVGQRSAASHAEVMGAYDRGEILRTHVLRPTWHFVSPADLRWMLALSAPRIHRQSAPYYARSGLTERVRGRAGERIARALEGGRFLTREELAAELARARIVVEKEALAYVMMHAELEGIVTSGPMRKKAATYALVSDRVPKTRPLDRDEALGAIVRRYFDGHAPASERDCAWWAGLTLGEVRRGIEIAGDAIAVREGRVHSTSHVPRPAKVAPRAHFLSNYDEYLIAYQDRSDFFSSEAVKLLGPADRVFAAHFVLVDGKLVGGWRRLLSKKELVLEAAIVPLRTATAKKALASATITIGRFFGVPARIA